MKYFRRKLLTLISIIMLLLLLMGGIPFVIRSCHNSLFDLLSLSMAIISTIATIFTLVIAILLYDRFGLKTKFIEKQLEKVLELADLIKGKSVTVRAEGLSYMIRPRKSHISSLKDFPTYTRDYQKLILISDNDFTLALKEILAISRSYWLPDEIRIRMSFLEFAAYASLEEANIEEDQCVKFDFNEVKIKEWVLVIPTITFGEFVTQLQELVLEIEKWLENHFDFPIDLKFEEPSN